MKDNNNNSKQVLLSVLGVAILVVAVVGVSFAAFSYSKPGEKVNTITTGTITMNYSEVTNGINLVNALPMSDEQGKALTGEGNVFDFTVTATISGSATINYSIIAVPDESNGAVLTDDKIKVYLTDQASPTENGEGNTSTPQILSSLPASNTVSDLTGAPDTADDYVLKSDSITTNNTTDNYRLRMWIDANATAPTSQQTYKLRVNVYGKADAE